MARTTVEIVADVNWAPVIAGLQAIRDAAVKCTAAIDQAIATLKEASDESGTSDAGTGRASADHEADRLKR